MPRREHLPLDLLETFALIAELDGNASAAAERLGISQPSISKRLTALRRVTSDPDRQPWLHLKGKRWRLTAEGQRVRGVVSDLVQRYEQMEQFVADNREGKPVVAIACGQQAASGFVQAAVKLFLKEHPECRIRVSTPRGKARIEGVAGGQFDLAVVTDSPATIQKIAGREMFVEDLFDDYFVLAANPPMKSVWGKRWQSLPLNRPIVAAELLEMPLILPGADSSRRQQFDEWYMRATGKPLDVVLETGGWQSIIDFAEAGVGVGLTTRSATDAYRLRGNCKHTTRPLDPKEFPPDPVRLIARKVHGREEPELTEMGLELRRWLLTTVSSEN